MSCPREAGIQTSSRARRWPGFPLSAGMTCDAFISNVDETCRPPFTRAEPVAGSALRRCRFSGLERLPSTSSVGRGDLHRLSLYDYSLNNFFSNSRNRVTFADRRGELMPHQPPVRKEGLGGWGQFFTEIGPNPLKSPKSDEGFQGNPSLFALESLPFPLDSFGSAWPGLVLLGIHSASHLQNAGIQK
jgi:hypothetical protein